MFVLLLVAIGLGRSGSATGDAPVADPTSQPTRTFPPGTVRIIDEAAGISYPYLGDGWYEWALWQQEETTEHRRAVLHHPGGHPGRDDRSSRSAPRVRWPTDFGWAGPSTLQPTLAAVADACACCTTTRGPTSGRCCATRTAPSTATPPASTSSSSPGTCPATTPTGERAALLLIDVGRPAPALLYISIPNTHAELYGVIDRVLDAVDVL